MQQVSEASDRVAGPAERAEPVERFSELLRLTWRAVVRATRSAKHLPAVPEAQADVLHKLAETGPLTPAQLAGRMHLARPTISNLVRDLTAAGLLDRVPSPIDKRSVLLTPTSRAQNVEEEFRRGRVEVLAAAMEELDAADRDQLVAALPALGQLLRRLHTTGDPAAGDQSRPPI